jgi:hypothetical protein
MTEGIPYNNALVQSLEANLATAFNRPYLRLTRRPSKSGAVFRISLEGGDRLAEPDEGYEQMVMRVYTSNRQPTTFYFTFEATFEIETHKHSLQHASLTILHDLYAGELSPLFRADWDRKAASDRTSKHAQPHWHFVQRPERIEGIVRTVLSPPQDFVAQKQTSVFAGLVDCGKFHFAMSPLWDRKNVLCHKQVFEYGDFRDWFASLTKYVADQIGYLISKAPPLAPTEFVPV